MITLEKARQLASEQARRHPNIMGDGGSVLSDRYLEAEHCWMFFVNPKLIRSEENIFGSKWAFVVSKKGAKSMVNDFSGDPPRLLEYLQELSQYFGRRGE